MTLRRIGVRAPAKINLFLHAGEKRDDGYHALESLAVFAETADRMEFAPASELTLTIDGPFANKLAGENDNLILKAARALQASPSHPSGERARGRQAKGPVDLSQSERVRGSFGAHILLDKNLPVAAGIAGGSADAAAALRALNMFWDLNLTEPELLDIAAGLGSDVPACMLSSPCWMEGRGERVTRTDALPQFPLVLVNPGVMVPTGQVFADLNARTGIGAMQPPPRIQTLWDLVAYLEDAGNDLEAPAGRLAPIIEDVLLALDREPGCALAQMSGSGATCFGLFHEAQFAAGAAERIAQDHPDWWVRLTRIAAPDIGDPEYLP